MNLKVVIDKDILGWSDKHKEELKKKYHDILQVSKHPDLPQRIGDEEVAKYCKEKKCDLMTADVTSYTHFYKAGIKTVKITKYDYWQRGDRPVYLVQIESQH